MTTNILILCTHNSARSVLGEAMINHWAGLLKKPVRAFSAGSQPKGKINPLALTVLAQAGIDTAYTRSKSWDEFSVQPAMRLVITVCDSAASEQCPIWPGSPVSVHWGYPDPSDAVGDHDKKIQDFELTRQAISYRVLQLVKLPFEHLTDLQLKAQLETIWHR
jgi:arsenate reductase (thioredoxin)